MTLDTFMAQYMTPVHQVMYVILLVVGGGIWSQIKWADKARHFVKVFVVKSTGDTDTVYAPKSGISVSLTNPKSKTTRTWPINKLSTIETLYPGDGLVPMFMQKKIKTVIVDEDDWEPLLNRGSYSENVASPDVVLRLKTIAESYKSNNDVDKASAIMRIAENLSIAPTREMIASPAVFGNLILEKVSEALLTVNKETMDILNGLIKKMDNVVSSNKLYICTGLIIAAVAGAGFIAYQSQAKVDEVKQEIDLIENALGIVKVTANVTAPNVQPVGK